MMGQIPQVGQIPHQVPLLAAGDLFEDLDFAGARAAYAEIARVTDGEARRVARHLEILSEIFDRATRNVPRRLPADAPQEVTLTNDRVLIGQATIDVLGNVTLKTDQGISATFSPGQVESVRRVETATWRAKNEAELRRRLEEVGRELPAALDYFQAAYFCIRNGLGDRAADLLMKSSQADGFPMVIETLGGEDAGRLLARWEGLTRPGVEVAAPASAVSRGDSLPEAERLYQRALVHYRKSWPGMAHAADELKKARALFEDARDVVERAKMANPDDRKLEARLQDLQTLIYDCIKRAIL